SRAAGTGRRGRGAAIAVDPRDDGGDHGHGPGARDPRVRRVAWRRPDRDDDAWASGSVAARAWERGGSGRAGFEGAGAAVPTRAGRGGSTTGVVPASGLGGEREREGEGGSGALAALDVNRAAVRLHDSFDDGQPEADPVPLGAWAAGL